MKSTEYRIRQRIELANGQVIQKEIGQCLDGRDISNLKRLSRKYKDAGFDVKIVKITTETTEL